jgi:hypothetical protein
LCIQEAALADEYWELWFTRSNHPASKINATVNGVTFVLTGGGELMGAASVFEENDTPQG